MFSLICPLPFLRGVWEIYILCFFFHAILLFLQGCLAKTYFIVLFRVSCLHFKYLALWKVFIKMILSVCVCVCLRMILRVIIPVPVVDGDFSHELTCIEKSMHYYDFLCEKNFTTRDRCIGHCSYFQEHTELPVFRDLRNVARLVTCM